MKNHYKFMKSILVGTLLFSIGGCAQAKETSETSFESVVEEATTQLQFEDVYETLLDAYPNLTVTKNVKTDAYHWFKSRNEVTVDGNKFYIDEYENQDDAKMYDEVVEDYNALEQYATDKLGVTSAYLTQEDIDLDSYKINDMLFDRFVFVYPTKGSDKVQKEIKTTLKSLETMNDSTYSSKEYSKLYEQRKEEWNKDAYNDLNSFFEEKDQKNQSYVNEVIAKYQDTSANEENYLTLNREVKNASNEIIVVSSTQRYKSMYEPLNNRLNEIETQCSSIITNHSNDLDSKITSLENEMNYDLLKETNTLYQTYKSQDAYASKVDEWDTKITDLNEAAETKKAEEEAAKKAEEERLAAEAAKKAEEEAAKKAEEERLAAEAAKKAQQEQQTQAAAQKASEPVQEMVWIPKTGKKYHSRSSCSNMKNPSQVTKEQAKNSGYSPCKKCYG